MRSDSTNNMKTLQEIINKLDGGAVHLLASYQRLAELASQLEALNEKSIAELQKIAISA